MSLSMGIVGLPNVGKSTLFNALTKKCVPAENYPFCTIDPSVGVVAVPDERIWKLSEFSKSAKTIPAAVEFVDIAGLVKGASAGEGLGNKFLAHIREVDAIAQVVRVFEDSNILHVDGGPNPVRDIEVINMELILSDMETVTKRLGNVEKDVRKGSKEAIVEKDMLTKVLHILESENLVPIQRAESRILDQDSTNRGSGPEDFSLEEIKILKNMQLITMKPIIYVLNQKSGSKNVDTGPVVEFITNKLKSQYVFVDAGLERDLSELTEEEKIEYRSGLGVSESGINSLIKESYNTLGLITYLTTGEDETRAWTVKKDSTAPVAGLAIHGDFKDKFIRAEVINWQELLNASSYGSAREKGLVRTEGKEYVVQDGDVIEFKI
ncbi:MAG: redox-regulated ATPase YchF [bacterium]|nr:redox-regulated ATPase YchF [bacterium]